ncbi:crossover junction endodeoxyribonuclease RuvC [Prosthecochloris sp. N3]|uniref:Crossover junction endodeoxyribonuclease RuvC n=1 Tax=Prosthecochloris ethylica TaxID=2743976 RepID=A0ABR9XQM7_9CHLB|nr:MULTISPECIES: crossover junction endodeoxyribonuclease RuvC [Prosthecochloris]MEC9485893.1 crossover junction endodeoxyribonuclease RuvC [Prosthecochloris sp.]MBF0586517.1 crossover junction endodeoxyribonuclease RuvC [Prosthecochloris ethylica]MBF0636130.1 crossover junction endodeoxyribonuclease RuvC [Prosthecochloris ethylica]NUK47733.1 crossover junction endodeoxyribonuclease RuvC [Prosthecochloris ethylica]RNA64395.1 crossover junction endodeoxyribonuclease RuvC [Prosthecochloris sp. Z
MLVLGVDPGSVHTGYGLVSRERNGWRLVSCGVIRLRSAQSLPERIKIIYDELDALVSEYGPVRLALETTYVNRNAQSALKLGQVRGAIVVLAMNRGLVLHEYAPREVKLVLTGKGGAGKGQVAYMVQHFLGITTPLKPYDVSDALGIALCDLFCDAPGGQRRGTSGRSSSSRGWAEYVRSNPELIV